ncbi:MAG: tetratricopeptide repeat protein [Ignavibacteriales bacterium]|nr:tetratricopeptide repeat protein [Ignavibacteriales bacterium]
MLCANNKKLFAAVSIIITSLAVSSCGIWTNFTTFFNTYYNTKTLFDYTEAALQQTKKDPFVFKEEKIPDAQSKDLTKVIEKCSKILQFNEESSYFDDALFITGKSFYYQQEYSKAQRKFIELASIPETDYALENKLWLAKTYLQLRSFEDGLKLLDEVKAEAQKEEDEEIFNRASITKIGFFVYRDEYASAVTESNSFLASLDDEETAALVWYQLGKIYLLQKDEEKALQAFESVLKYSASFEIEFESRIEHAKLLGELGKLDESEEALVELRDEGKFKNQMDRILIEVGNIYFDKHEDEKAIEVFREVDSTYKKNPTAGIASMKLGEIYETRIKDYDSAYSYYNKTVNSSADRELKLKAGQKARNMSKYFQLQSLLSGYELQLEYVTDNDRFIRDSIDFDIAYNQFLEESRKKQEENEKTGQQQNKPAQQRSQQQAQQQQQTQQQTFSPSDKNLDLVTLILQGKVTKPVRPKISVDSIKTQIAQSYYSIGGMFFSEFEVPDSARFYYEEILEKFPSEKPYMVQTMYALGTYYETVNEKEKADSLFKIIYEKYPKDKLYKEAGKKLGLLTDEDKALLADTKDPAEKIYVKAEDFYYNKNYRAAIDTFKTIYLKYPRSNFAPKSIYYIGLIYEEESKNDSAAFFYKILTTKEYLQTPYGKAVSAKYNEYKAEMEKIEKAKQEELQKQKELEELEKQKLLQLQSDSVGVDSNKTLMPGDLQKRKISDDEILSDSLDNREGRKKQPYIDRIKAEQADTLKSKVVDPELLKPEKIDSLRRKTAGEGLKRAENDSTIEKKINPTKPKPGEKDTTKVRTTEPE